MPRVKKTWVRARKPEQKEERRSAILATTGELLDQEGLEGTGLNAIARRVDVAKANIYRYFESREAILLELLLDEVRSWADALAKRLRRHAGNGDPDAVARAFADTIAARPRYCILIGSLATVLEHNVGAETVADFKRQFNALADPAVAAFEAALPSITYEDSYEVLAMLAMAASGAWPHCHPSPVVKEVLARKEFAAMRFDFKQTMRRIASAMLRGMIDPN